MVGTDARFFPKLPATRLGFASCCSSSRLPRWIFLNQAVNRSGGSAQVEHGKDDDCEIAATIFTADSILNRNALLESFGEDFVRGAPA